MAAAVYRRKIEQQHQSGRYLGRHVVHDPASKDFPAEQAKAIISVDHSYVGLPLNQGDIGSCTANALVGCLNTAPDLGPTRTKVRNEKDAKDAYHVETTLEGQPWPPNDPGGSGLEVCKAGKQLGWVKSYHHAFGLVAALRALVIRPVMFGVNWYDSFDNPDPKTGIVELPPGATIRGGHEIMAFKIDVASNLVWLCNSWGLSYGIDGTFAFPFEVLTRLLSEEGDCTVPIPA